MQTLLQKKILHTTQKDTLYAAASYLRGNLFSKLLKNSAKKFKRDSLTGQC